MRTKVGLPTCPDELVAGVIAAQHGVLHRRQAVEAGMTTKMIRGRLQSGRWSLLHPSVFRLAGTAQSWEQTLMAACLATGHSGVASHRAAAALWRIDGFDRTRTVPIELLVDRRHHPRVAGATVHRTASLGPADRGERDSIPATSPVRTLIDLAAVLSAEALEIGLHSALRDGLVSPPYLAQRIRQIGSSGRAGTGLLLELVSNLGSQRPHDSPPEVALARALLAQGPAGLVRQYELLDDREQFVARFDLAYPAVRLGVEFDSYRYHSGRHAWRRDQSRHNGAAAMGWLVMRITEDELRGPMRDLIEMVTSAHDNSPLGTG